MDEFFQLKIISPQNTLFEGQVLAVSSKNSSGPFDILAEHADFITIIENEPIIIRLAKGKNLPAGRQVTLEYPLCIIYTRNNNVTIYVKTEFLVL